MSEWFLPDAPPCYRTHGSSEFCPKCAAWNAFMHLPHLAASVERLARAVEPLEAGMTELRDAIKKLREKIG